MGKFRDLIYIFISFTLLTVSYASAAQSSEKISRDEYIQIYKDIAINEMALYGIPASITLAQGILESGHGNSALTREANNHFGIKCHTGWKGKKYHMDDDAENECFRVYDDAAQSFRDHSLFLKNRLRYQFLFDFKKDDYKAWAKGLKKAGYATNPRYPQLLIKIIEDHQLYRFDSMKPNEKPIYVTNDSDDEKAFVPQDRKKYKFVENAANGRKVFENNGVKFIYAKKDDNFLKIAVDFNIYAYQVYKNNDLDKDDQLVEGQMVYLERKKRKGSSKYHKVAKNESMHAISQKYGIRLKQLYRKNRMPEGSQAVPGEQLYLQKRRPK